MTTAQTAADAKKKPAAKNYREMRRKLDLNQSAFWGKIGITQSGGCRYETGRRVPESARLLAAIAYGTDKEALAEYLKLRGKGDGSKLSKAEQAYQEAVSSLKLVEISTRHTLGVVHTRASFMSLLDKR